jgi:hypothetical protein
MLELAGSWGKSATLLTSFCLCVILRSEGAAAEKEVAVVTESTMSLTMGHDTLYVNTVGRIRNDSDELLDDVVVEVEYFDKDGKLIDASIEQLYGVKVPVHDTVAFRVSVSAAASRERYASHTARVISAPENHFAKSAPAAGTRSERSLTKKSLMVWIPLVFLAAISLYIIRRSKKRSAAQGRSVDLIEKQIDLFDSQNRILERIAVAAEDPRSHG